MRKYKGAQSRPSHSRKRSFGKTKPNFRSLVKQEKDDFLNMHGARIKIENPALYYSIIGRKLPKKYQNQFSETKPTPSAITPVKVPEKTPEEIAKELEVKRIKEEKARALREEKIKQEAIRRKNQEAVARERKYVFWCNAYEQGNYRSIHSEEYKSKTEKKYEYY
jgi:GTP-dependent phosphoenolpyruvate carboxykinase